MPNLRECLEWRLIRSLGELLSRRKAPYELPQMEDDQDADHDLYDYELHRTFGPYSTSLHVSETEFAEITARLRGLCLFLDTVVDARFRGATTNHQVPSSPSSYDFLQSLHRQLQELESGQSSTVFNLASGPSPRLFDLSGNAQILKLHLSMITSYNDFVTRLFKVGTGEIFQRHNEATKDRDLWVWEDVSVRNHVIGTFRALFAQFACGLHHKIMLKLSEDTDRHLHLWLLQCPEGGKWQEAICLTYGREESTLSGFQNLCEELQKHWDYDKTLHLLLEQDGHNGMWTFRESGLPSSESPPKQSLEHLITDGAFRPLGPNIILSGKRSPNWHSPQQRRDLAVKLSRCLMNFFDTTLDDKNIYLRHPSTKQRDVLYMAFSGIPGSSQLRVFRIGHPILLSFAKLLLEIEYGEKIAVDISMNYNENLHNWAELCQLVEGIQEQKEDSYLQAIEGCLKVHQKIFRVLKLSQAEGQDADLLIREHIYKNVVQRLEDALSEVTPRLRRKRGRSGSQSPPSGATELADRAKEPKRNSVLCNNSVQKGPQRERGSFKKQRSQHLVTNDHRETFLHKSQKLTQVRFPNDFVSNSQPALLAPLLPELTSGFFDDNTQVEHSSDSCQYADAFMMRQQKTYENTIAIEVEDRHRVKVAILDTGIDLSHPSSQARLEQIKDVRSWVDGQDGNKETTPLDESGHGTHVSHLLLDMAPDCDLFVARIARTQPTSPEQVAKAIQYAVAEWRVDIISMSFGYADESDPGCYRLSHALDEARKQNVLLFAAASNSGAFADLPAFPARHSSVFCIHSSDGMGNSGRTTLTAQKRRDNLCAPGEAIRSAWPLFLLPNGCKKSVTQRKSGTSYSTPIVAGIAAFILLYARQNLPERSATRFKEHDKMRDMLIAMSRHRQGYDVISTTSFFERPQEWRVRQMMDILDGLPWKT